MKAVRSLMVLIRLIGIGALALVLAWFLFPASLGKWLDGDKPQAPEAPALQGASAMAATPAVTAPPKAVPAPQATPAAAALQAPKAARGSASQVAVAQWLGSKYRVSPAYVEALVVEADLLAKRYRFSPNLLMAVMAIESNFHPYIQSEAGAQGLMQVMPVIHAKRYEKFGGKKAFLNPLVSLKVGAEILRDCMKLRDGSENEALRFYFGGGASSDAYIAKVRAEQRLLNRVAAGARVPVE